VVPRFEAEVFQHVGDEVVFTWNEAALRDKHKCLLFYFAVRHAIAVRGDHYRGTYGISPEFKAGMHAGEVIAVEVGDIKREIAYHGDTINTASRIQAACREFDRSLLVSGELLRLCDLHDRSPLRTEALGNVLLKGKYAHVNIHSVEQVSLSGPIAGSIHGTSRISEHTGHIA
jgi:adenylate cyclase